MHVVFWLKLALLATTFGFSLWLLFSRRPSLESATPRWVIPAYYGVRFGLLGVAVLFLHFNYSSENTWAYYHYGELVLRGQMPNRDFFVLYNIFFSYLMAGGLIIWHHPFMLYLVLQGLEGICVYVIFRQRNVALPLRGFLLYAVNPITVVWVWLALQNQTLCLIPIAALLAVRRETSRSLLFSIGFAVSKIFALWTIVPALAFMRIRSMALFGVATALIYAPFLLAGSRGFSSKATEADGKISDNTGGNGIESLIGLIPQQGVREKVAHASLLLTAGCLLLVMLAALLIRWRLGAQRVARGPGEGAGVVYACVLATLLTLIFQAFSPYTVPEYLIAVVALGPLLLREKFWSQLDAVCFLVLCFLQASIFLLWFHFAEFGNPNPRTNGFFVTLLVLGNIAMIGFCLRHAVKALAYFQREIASTRAT